MHISTVRPVDLDAAVAQELAALANRTAAVDAPHMPAETGETLRLRLAHGWDGESTERLLVARDSDGTVLGFAEVEAPTQENRNLVWFHVDVDPVVRRRGIGTALFHAVGDAADEVGRGLLMSAAWHNSAGSLFLKRHEFTQGMMSAQRRLLPHLLPRAGDDALLDQARAASAAYDVVRVAGPLSAELREQMLSTVEAINDAPLDDLELEDDNFTVDRLRRYDVAQQALRHRLYRVIAFVRETGEPAGQTVVAVDGLRPHHGEQHDTTVRREHRGHRLGLRLKLEMLQWLREQEPQLRQVDTWNAESNHHMLAVNDLIGCTVVGRQEELQRHVGAGV
jgi:GNAT superfamily N-acetyltransferase